MGMRRLAGVIDTMKTSPTFCRAILLTGIFALTGFTVALADDNSSDSTPPPPPPGHHSSLTSDEWAELKKDHEAVFAANPDLKAQEKNLREQEHALREKIDAAIVKEDPNAAPILEKLKAAHPHHGPPPGDEGNGGNQ